MVGTGIGWLRPGLVSSVAQVLPNWYREPLWPSGFPWALACWVHNATAALLVWAGGLLSLGALPFLWLFWQAARIAALEGFLAQGGLGPWAAVCGMTLPHGFAETPAVLFLVQLSCRSAWELFRGRWPSRRWLGTHAIGLAWVLGMLGAAAALESRISPRALAYTLSAGRAFPVVDRVMRLVPGGPQEAGWAPDQDTIIWSDGRCLWQTSLRVSRSALLFAGASGEWLRHPRVSPDGRLVAAHGRAEDGHYLVVLRRSDGSLLARVAVPGGRRVTGGPEWADARSRLWVLGSRSRESCLLEFTLEHGWQAERSLPYPALGLTASLDGNIALSVLVDRRRKLVVSPPEWQNWTPITAGPGDRGPALSPDGRRVAFVRGDRWGPRLNGDLCIVDTHTGALEGPLVLADVFSVPAWSPDGTRLLYTRAGFLLVLEVPAARTQARLTDGAPRYTPQGPAALRPSGGCPGDHGWASSLGRETEHGDGRAREDDHLLLQRLRAPFWLDGPVQRQRLLLLQ